MGLVKGRNINRLEILILTISFLIALRVSWSRILFTTIYLLVQMNSEELSESEKEAYPNRRGAGGVSVLADTKKHRQCLQKLEKSVNSSK